MLQDQAHEAANVASMLLKATKLRAEEQSNQVEVNNTLGSILPYFYKACVGPRRFEVLHEASEG